VSTPGPRAEVAACDQIRTLLGQLGRREREVLLRFHRDGRSITELAAAEAVSAGTIKSLLHRARARPWAAFQHGEQP
jgi:DNA-directed RNA polymerase specialized sigma24 family protein